MRVGRQAPKAPQATIYLYPDGRMVVTTTDYPPADMRDRLMEQAKRVHEAWASGEAKAVVVGPDIEVVMVPPDYEARIARLEELAGLR